MATLVGWKGVVPWRPGAAKDMTAAVVVACWANTDVHSRRHEFTMRILYSRVAAKVGAGGEGYD
jgi:hypothetical protein